MPHFPNRQRSEVALTVEPPCIEQILRPIAQGPAKPLIYGHSETSLWTVEKLLWKVTAEHFAQHDFAAPALQLKRKRQSPRELQDPVVE
jgi:hypothetical protein